MRRILLELGHPEVDDEGLQRAIDRFSFERMTGRATGDESRTEFIRKGTVGDWRNHFSREAGEVFHRSSGVELRGLGYEEDPEWFKNLEPLPEGGRASLPPDL